MTKKSKVLLCGLIKLAVILSSSMSESEVNTHWGWLRKHAFYYCGRDKFLSNTLFWARFVKFFIFFSPCSDSLKSLFNRSKRVFFADAPPQSDHRSNRIGRLLLILISVFCRISQISNKVFFVDFEVHLGAEVSG
jgi:hypothetical protein